jgi:hypothetical protein
MITYGFLVSKIYGWSGCCFLSIFAYSSLVPGLYDQWIFVVHYVGIVALRTMFDVVRGLYIDHVCGPPYTWVVVGVVFLVEWCGLGVDCYCQPACYCGCYCVWRKINILKIHIHNMELKYRLTCRVYKWSINGVTTPNTVYSQSYTWQYDFVSTVTRKSSVFNFQIFTPEIVTWNLPLWLTLSPLASSSTHFSYTCYILISFNSSFRLLTIEFRFPCFNFTT